MGFAFYLPDPALTAWNQEDKRLKQAGVAAKERPPKPAQNANYPTKQALALGLLRQLYERPRHGATGTDTFAEI